jgi:hypothetical protein
MFFPSATVVAALALSLTGTGPLADRAAPRGAPARAAVTKVAASLWAPKKSSSSKKSQKDIEAEEEELLKPRRPAGGDTGAKQKPRRPIKMDANAEEGGDDEADEGDDDDEDKPKIKRRKRASEDEDEDAAEPIASQPPIIPRLVSFEVGPTYLRRSFGFSQATEQGDHAFRYGYQFGLESFPMVTQPDGWYRTLGVGGTFEKEYGDATRTQPSGLFMGAPVNHTRWGFDVRYAIPAGEWLVIMPAVGYGRVGVQLERMTPTMPSMCLTSNPDPCFGGINAGYLSADLHLRAAILPNMALSLVGGYLQGLGVGRGADQITAEASASMSGFHVDLGASLMIGDYFAVSAAIPFRRYVFNFSPVSGAAFTARSATDQYVGVIAGFAVFTK